MLSVAVVIALIGLSSCSGSKHQATASSEHVQPAASQAATPTGAGTASGAGTATTAAITTAFTTFFDGTSPVTTRLSFLQNAPTFEQALASESGASVINETSATVSHVTAQSPDIANVVYTISLSGKPLLENVTGTAVQIDGDWKVSAGTFCSLLKLEGQAPAACSQAATTALPS